MSDADFSDLSRVGLAHTTITDEDIPVQIYADLIHFVILAYVADREVYSIQFHDLKDMTDSVLNGMGFDDLIALA